MRSITQEGLILIRLLAELQEARERVKELEQKLRLSERELKMRRIAEVA